MAARARSRALACAAVCALALACAAPRAAAVTVLDEGNFDELALSGGKSAFVKFFAPWCGHCKAMKPAWDELGAEMADSNSVLIGDVDCTEQNDLCSRFDVSGYPTVMYFTSDKPEGEKYTGGRNIVDLREFVKEELGARCSVADAESTCSSREAQYIAKMRKAGAVKVAAQEARLQKVKGDVMTAELKAWVNQRHAILTQLRDELK